VGVAGDRLRGHSSIEAAVDLALLVEREEGSDSITLRSTKTRDVEVAPFGAMFTYAHAPGTTKLQTARFYGQPVDDERSDRAIERAIGQVLGEARELLKMDLCARVHARLPQVGINRVRGVIERLAKQSRLQHRPGPKGGEYFWLPSTAPERWTFGSAWQDSDDLRDPGF
jgi:hypothetical protein